MFRWLPALILSVPALCGAAPPFERPSLGLNPDTLRDNNMALEVGLPDATLDQRGDTDTTTLAVPTLIRLRLVNRLELQAAITGYRFEQTKTDSSDNEQDGMGNSAVGAKFALYRGPMFRAAVAGGVLIDTASDAFSNNEDGGYAAMSGGWWMDDLHQIQLSARYEEKGKDRTITVVPSWHARLNDTWAVFLDAGLTHNTENGDDNNRAGGGVTWMLTPTLQADLYGRGGLDSDSVDSEAGMGLAIAF